MAEFTYPTGIATGFSGLASYFAARIAGVTGYSGMAAPPVPTGNHGFLQAMADALLGAVGHQASDFTAGSSASSVGPTAFTDVPGYTSMTFAAPKAGYYEVKVDLRFFAAVLGTTPDAVTFAVVVGSTTYGDDSAAIYVYRASEQFNHSFRVSAWFAAGANTVKLQWKCGDAGTTLNTNSSSGRKFTISG